MTVAAILIADKGVDNDLFHSTLAQLPGNGPSLSNAIFAQSSVNDTQPLNGTQEWISEKECEDIVHIST